MSIVLDESKFYEEILKGEHTYLSITAVTKYLTIANYKEFSRMRTIKPRKGEERQEFYTDVDAVLNEIYPFLVERFNEKHVSDNLSEVVKTISKYSKKGIEFRTSSGIKIYKSELDEIMKLEEEILQKIAFGMLVDQKIHNLKTGEFSRTYKKKLRDYFKRFTDNKMNKMNQNKKINILHKEELIGAPEVELYGCIEQFDLLYMEEDTGQSAEILITDFREIILIYRKYIGENIICCEDCNRLIEVKPRSKTTRCSSCQNKKDNKNKRKWDKNNKKELSQTDETIANTDF